MGLPWMDIAWKQEGQKEVSGAAANPAIIAYFRDAGHPEVQSDEVAWCAAFACSCLERAGIRSPRSLAARSFLDFGTPIDQARTGAIAVFSRPPSAEHGHVGFVVGETPSAVVLLGGNQANSVSVVHMPKARLLGYRWPDDDATAGDLKGAGSRTVKAADASIQAQTIAGGAIATAAAGQGWTATVQDHASQISQIADTANQYRGAVSVLMDVWQFAQHSWLWLAALIGAYFGGKAIWHVYQIKKYRTEDANTGAHQGTGGTKPDAVPADDFIR